MIGDKAGWMWPEYRSCGGLAGSGKGHVLPTECPRKPWREPE